VSNVEQMLEELEARYSTCPGTQICRQIDPDSDGFRWCVAVGRMMDPKQFYHGYTVTEALEVAVAGERKRLANEFP